MAIYEINDELYGLAGGVGFAGAQKVTTASWVHLALVATARHMTFYVGGVASGTATTPPPEPGPQAVEVEIARADERTAPFWNAGALQ